MAPNLQCFALLGVAWSTGLSPVCTTTGPAATQRNSRRVGNTTKTVEHIQDSTACAKLCCEEARCSAWSFHEHSCELLAGYAVLSVDTASVSGVVYRTGIQTAPWSELRGFNYVPAQNFNSIDMWRDYDMSVVERDLDIALQTGFNFARVFLNFHVWDAQGDTFLDNVRHFIAAAHQRNIDVMPVVFDLCWFGCTDEVVSVNSSGKCWYPSPQYSLADDRSWWSSHGERYADALLTAFPVGTPGLLLWDVVNEPETGGSSGLPDEHGYRWQFVEHFVDYFKTKSKTPTTVGCSLAQSLETVAAHVDVLSFHSYHASWEAGLQITHLALSVAEKYSKPVFNSETGCIARANSYDQTMEMCVRNGIGFAIWELMISDCLDCVDTRRWKHGLMYTDGTTRDPAAIAALHGVFINRGDDVPLAVPRTDVEGVASGAVKAIATWLAANASADYYAGVALLDEYSNLAESAATAPLVVPPSALARQLAAAGETLETRAQLVDLLSASVEPLQATKDGKETAPGVCSFQGFSQEKELLV